MIDEVTAINVIYYE